jgi:hypothetical protein
MHDRHIGMLKQTAVKPADLEATAITLRRLERFWMHGGEAAASNPQAAA